MPAVYKNNPKEHDRLRESNWRRRGVVDFTMTDYWRLFKEQGGVCAVCNKPERMNRRLAADHDVKTGKVRGLLCSFCNHRIVGTIESEKGKQALRYLGYVEGSLG